MHFSAFLCSSCFTSWHGRIVNDLFVGLEDKDVIAMLTFLWKTQTENANNDPSNILNDIFSKLPLGVKSKFA